MSYRINPYSGVRYKQERDLTNDKFIQYPAAHTAHMISMWSRMPLKQKFRNEARFWGYPRKAKTTLVVGV